MLALFLHLVDGALVFFRRLFEKDLQRFREDDFSGAENIELFQYQSPDQAKTLPKNSDFGGHHIALYVDDIDKAAAYLRSKDVKTMQGPIPVNEGPAAGQSILYFLTPWGLQMELISYPKGMAYEKSAKTVLWSTTEPMK